ncbi:MAG: T9SS type A sorting domain-containing protein [Chitinophagaceae bacterium]
MKRTKYILAFSLCLLGLSVNAQYQRAGFWGGKVFGFYESAGQVYAASNAGVFVSSNNGKTWANTSNPENVFGCDDVLCVAASMNDMYAATANLGVFRSTDAGATWSSVNTNLKKAGANYNDVEVVGPNALLIRPDSGLLYLTTDQGMLWQRVTIAINNSKAYSLSKRNGILYLVTNTGLYTSGNNGLNFMNINSSITDGKLYWANDTAYLATNNGVLQSQDFGMTFSSIGLTGRKVTNVAALGQNIFASITSATGVDTIKYSNDGGLSYSNAPANLGGGFAFRKVNDFFIADTSVFVGTNYDLFASKDGGHSWQGSNSGFYSTAVVGIAASNKNLFAATPPRGIYRTSDSAKTWQHVGSYANGLEGEIRCIDAKPGFVFAGDTGSFYRSLDSGASWVKISSGLAGGLVSSIYAVPNSGDVWVIQGGNLFLSVNNGSSFIAVPSTGIKPNLADLIIGIDTNIFVNAGIGFYHAGKSNVFNVTSIIPAAVTSVVSNGGVFFAGTKGAGLYSSNDGNTWTAMSAAVLPDTIFSLAVDSGKLVAGTPSGLFRENSGNWELDTFQDQIVLSLFEDNGHLLVGTCGDLFTKPYPPQKSDVNVPICLAGSGPIMVYPNPVERSAKCSIIAQEAGPAQLTVREMTGKLVDAKAIRLVKGDNVFQFPLTLPTGIYLLQVSTKSEHFSEQIVVK